MVNNYKEVANMKFAIILRETRFFIQDFKNCAEITIILYEKVYNNRRTIKRYNKIYRLL